MSILDKCGLLILAFIGLQSCAVPADGAPSSTGGPVANVGTVTTVAGPGFCKGEARIDQRAAMVRALAVDTGGVVHVSTGPPSEGLVSKVDGEGRTRLFRVGANARKTDGPGAGKQSPSTQYRKTSVYPAGSLAPDGGGGVLIGAGSRILQVNIGAKVAGQQGAAQGGKGGTFVTDAQGVALTDAFKAIGGIAGDAAGNLYAADEIDQKKGLFVIRFFNRSSQPVTFYKGTPVEVSVAPGKVGTIVGGMSKGSARRLGPANPLSTVLQGRPPALAVEGAKLYLALFSDGRKPTQARARVVLVNLGAQPLQAHGLTVAPASVETVAEGRPPSGKDGGTRRFAPFSYLPGIAADGRGNLFLADESHNRIYKVDGDGRIDKFAGTGRPGFNGNDRPANKAELNRPFDVKVGPQDRIYISDRMNHQVRFVDEADFIRASPGNGMSQRWKCLERRIKSLPSSDRPRPGAPLGLDVDAAGNVYFSLAGLPLKKLTPAGRLTSIPSKAFGFPTALAARPGGGLYVLDNLDRRVKFLNTSAHPITVHGTTVAAGSARAVAGNGKQGGAGNGGVAINAELAGYGYLAADSRGNLLISEPDNGVRRVDQSGAIDKVLGGNPSSAPSECCARTAGIALDKSGNLYVGDESTQRVWFMNLGNTAVVVAGESVRPGETRALAGNGESGFGGDGGPALEAQFQQVGDLTVDRLGTVYVADPSENTVRAVTREGTIQSVLGTGGSSELGFNGDGLKGRLTALNDPGAIALDRCGQLYVVDGLNDRIRRLNVGGGCA